MDKQGVVQECWLSPRGTVCWISKVGIHGVMDKPPWYGVLDKQGAVQGCWLSPHGVVCWIGTVEYRGAG